MTELRPSTESELVELVRSIDEPAPESLHRKVEAMIADAGGESRGARQSTNPRAFGLAPRVAAFGAIAAALIALAVTIGLSGSSSTLSVRDAAAPTLRSATGAPPAESTGDHTELAASVEGVTFPYWGEHFGWRSSGSRSDEIDGRSVHTVFYSNSRGQRVGYAIAAGKSPAQLGGGVVSHRDGTPYWLLNYNGAAVVAWQRGGHLCVISGHGVNGATLLKLASWDDRRADAS